MAVYNWKLRFATNWQPVIKKKNQFVTRPFTIGTNKYIFCVFYMFYWIKSTYFVIDSLKFQHWSSDSSSVIIYITKIFFCLNRYSASFLLVSVIILISDENITKWCFYYTLWLILQKTNTAQIIDNFRNTFDEMEQERKKLERKRARNRAAATKCRLRKVQKINDLERQVIILFFLKFHYFYKNRFL